MIKKGDLPKKFVQVSAQTLLAPATSKWFPKASDLRSQGYAQSYIGQFSEFVPKSRAHVASAMLQEFADKYSGSDGGHWGYQGRLSGRYPKAKSLSVAQVGDESSAWHNVLPQPPGTEIEILFRQAGYVVELHCAGTLAKSGTCLHYANTIDARIQAKG
jgi:hypothetical protein